MTCQALYRTILTMLACLLLSGNYFNVHVAAARRPGRVDCTRYVFAPVCRGVAAKRNVLPTTSSDEVMSPPHYLDDFVLMSFLSSIREQNLGRTRNSVDNLRHLLKQTLPIEDQRQERIFQEQRDEERSLLPKLLVRSQRSPGRTIH